MQFKEKLLFFLKKHVLLKKIIRLFYFSCRIIFVFFVTYILFPIKGILRLCFYYKYQYLLTLKKIKNTASNDRCFIIATGPSLKGEDVEILHKKNEITYGLNSVFKLYEKFGYKPTYYVYADDDDVKKLLSETNNTFFTDKAEIYSFTDLSVINKDIKNDRKLLFIPYNRFLHGYKTIFDYHFKFSLNAVYGFFDYYTVTALAINIAAYMGYKKIYLLGVDCNYMGKAMHAKGMETGLENGATDKMKLYTAYSMKKGYEYLNQKLLKHGIRVYNATRGGELEVFPRVDFDELVKE
ncbi:DUF115 domain-containing protein [Treponema socranskii]|uniref:6-hydroxymethylpterin diphosphokinase MptE-like protein n=1 Tax=Treponema socranskii TaxID=53419 RepID=UPI003D92954E